MLFKKGSYSASVLVQGTRHKLTMTHPSLSPIGLWEAKCLDYNGATFRAHGKGATKAQADIGLQIALGLRPATEAPAAKPVPAQKVDGIVMHVPQSEFGGKSYKARSFVFGLTEICEALAEDRAKGMPDSPGEVRFVPAKPAIPGKSRAKAAKFEISPEALPEFWELVNAFHAGQSLKIIDKTQGTGSPLLVKVGG